MTVDGPMHKVGGYMGDSMSTKSFYITRISWFSNDNYFVAIVT